MDPNSADMLNNLLTFNDSQSQTPAERSDVTQHIAQDPRDQSHETPDKCMWHPLILPSVPVPSMAKLTAIPQLISLSLPRQLHHPAITAIHSLALMVTV